MANRHPRIENLAPAFKPGQSGNPKGRPKNRVPAYRAKLLGRNKARRYHEITPEELKDWYETLITIDLPSLKLLAQDDAAPALARTYARAIIFDMNAGKTYTVDRITERLFGKATQRIEHTGANGSELIPPARVLTKLEIKALLAELEAL